MFKTRKIQKAQLAVARRADHWQTIELFASSPYHSYLDSVAARNERRRIRAEKIDKCQNCNPFSRFQ